MLNSNDLFVLFNESERESFYTLLKHSREFGAEIATAV